MNEWQRAAMILQDFRSKQRGGVSLAHVSLSNLLQAARQGDNEAFHAIVKRMEVRVYQVLLDIVPDSEDALDLLQEVFLRLWQKLHLFDPRRCREPEAWVLTMARNLALDYWRRVARQPHILSLDLPAAEAGEDGEPLSRTVAVKDETPDPEGKGEYRQRLLDVGKALTRIRPEFRKAILLRAKGLGTERMAELLQCEPNTVGVWVHRGRQAIRAALGL